MSGLNISLQVNGNSDSSKLAVNATSAQSAVFTATSYLVTTDVDVFVTTGASPTALADGTDQILLAGNSYRILPLIVGERFAFITSGGSGNVYLTPNA
jgi:hypothetical protein